MAITPVSSKKDRAAALAFAQAMVLGRVHLQQAANIFNALGMDLVVGNKVIQPGPKN